MPDPSPARVAKCNCGGLTITVTAKPVNVHACTCTLCQRESGSVMTWSGWFPDASIKIDGAFTVWKSTGPRQTENMRAFCPICGGGGWFLTGGFLAGHTAIPIGTFSDSGFAVPHTVYWWQHHPDWLGEPKGPILHSSQ